MAHIRQTSLNHCACSVTVDSLLIRAAVYHIRQLHVANIGHGHRVKAGSQWHWQCEYYCECRREIIFYQSNSIPGVKFLDGLIGWMLTNAGVELELTPQRSRHDTCMLAPASYCEPAFKLEHRLVAYVQHQWTLSIGSQQWLLWNSLLSCQKFL